MLNNYINISNDYFEVSDLLKLGFTGDFVKCPRKYLSDDKMKIHIDALEHILNQVDTKKSHELLLLLNLLNQDESDEELEDYTLVNSLDKECSFPSEKLKLIDILPIQWWTNDKFNGYVVSHLEWTKFFGLDNQLITIEDHVYCPLTKKKFLEFKKSKINSIDQYVTYRTIFGKIPKVRKATEFSATYHLINGLSDILVFKHQEKFPGVMLGSEGSQQLTRAQIF